MTVQMYLFHMQRRPAILKLTLNKLTNLQRKNLLHQQLQTEAGLSVPSCGENTFTMSCG